MRSKIVICRFRVSGVKLINLPEGDKVACIAKVRKGDESEDDLVEPEESTEDSEVTEDEVEETKESSETEE